MPSKVFVIEDHPAIRAAYRQILARVPDLQISGEATTGSEALRKLAGHIPTIVLLDIMLPDINGVALLKQLKAYYPHLLVLVISSEDEEIYAPITAQAGASGYMNKCYAGNNLVKQIRMIVGEQNRN
ncbi:MAG: response regulator transcription factor [Caldilineaceae bacterium]